MYGLMGLGAVLLVASTLPLAWQIWRRPAAGLRPEFVAAVVIGLVLCCALGGGFGIYMSQGSTAMPSAWHRAMRRFLAGIERAGIFESRTF